MQPDFNQLMREAQKSMQKMQQDMAKMQEDLGKLTIEGTAGGGAVKVTCNGVNEFLSVKIQPEAVDPADVETLEDLVLAAIKDASQKTQTIVKERSGNLTRGLGLPPGLGF
jgi:DNA-binding YbaB/EbfC family protein